MCTMMNSADDDEQRFLVSGTSFNNFDELTTTLRNLLLCTKLPPQEIIQNIALYFTVTKLDSSETRAIACSSSTKQHKLQQCLIDSKSSWWISSMGSFRKGMSWHPTDETDAIPSAYFCFVFLSLYFQVRVKNGWNLNWINQKLFD